MLDVCFMLIVGVGMVSYGYGSIDETPAVGTSCYVLSEWSAHSYHQQIYMLQYFTPDILNFFAGQHTGYITGELDAPHGPDILIMADG